MPYKTNSIKIPVYPKYGTNIIPTGAASHDLPTPQQDGDAPKGAQQMTRDEPVQSATNQQGSFWNSLGSIASSVQSTVSVNLY